MTWGKDGNDEKVRAAAMEEGVAIPATVTERPMLGLWDELYWECFMELTGTRPFGYSVGYIPWTAIDAWARRHRIVDPFQFSTLCRMVTALDIEYVTQSQANKERG